MLVKFNPVHFYNKTCQLKTTDIGHILFHEQHLFIFMLSEFFYFNEIIDYQFINQTKAQFLTIIE